MGNFVRGLALSVSGFLGMSLCLNYSSSPAIPYLVPVGLASVIFGVLGFILMVSGMNQEPEFSGSAGTDSAPNIAMDHSRMNDGMDLGRLDEPTAKF